MSPLGFKARVGSALFELSGGICYTFPEIHLWCNTCWPLGGQHGSRVISSTYLRGIGGTRNQELSCRCSQCEIRQTLYRLSYPGSARMHNILSLDTWLWCHCCKELPELSSCSSGIFINRLWSWLYWNHFMRVPLPISIRMTAHTCPFVILLFAYEITYWTYQMSNVTCHLALHFLQNVIRMQTLLLNKWWLQLHCYIQWKLTFVSITPRITEVFVICNSVKAARIFRNFTN